MSAENKAIVRRLFEEVINKGNLAVVDEIIAPNLVLHDPTVPGLPGGLEGAKQIATMVRTGFPDVHYTIEDIIAEGDRVVVRFTFRGNHKGDFRGITPTGEQVTVTGISIYRVVGGKIEEDWGVAVRPQTAKPWE